jgi:hypothetical protein
LDIRITKTRAAMAVLFVLAGIGLGSLLSPLVGSALATVGQTVNISDHSADAYFAKVTSAGELKTNGVVSGKVAPALPPQPFSRESSVNLCCHSSLVGPTTATVALTDVTFANWFGNSGRELTLYQVSATASGCTNNYFHVVGVYDAQSGQTVVQDFATPSVLKPLASGQAWCLLTDLSGAGGDSGDNRTGVTVGGYVLSGTYTPPNAPPPGKAGVLPRRAR